MARIQGTNLIERGTVRVAAPRPLSAERTPTAEQQDIIEAYVAGDNLVIEAGAGTGKTSTLKMLAAAAPDRRGIYVAYNRAIADDARASFPSSVNCATAHSLAFRAVGRRFAHRLNGPRMPARETARILGINGWRQLSHERVLSPAHVARLVMDTVNRFCWSSDEAIGDLHVPVLPGLDDPESMHTLRAFAVPMARRAWADISSENGKLKYQHDHYLKTWQLTEPTLPCDFVLLDEAQDANPVVASIVGRQHHAQRVWVGDRSQSIYQWRGAVDAMSDAGGRHLVLSQSFRFGQPIADEANKWLTLLRAPLRLRGFEGVTSTVALLEAPHAVLCRTNAEAVGQVMAAQKRGQSVALVGGGQDISRLAEAAMTLKTGDGTDHPELFAFRSWGEVREHVEHDSAGSDLKTFVRLIDTHGPTAVMDATERLVDEGGAALVVSTAHKAKGREWDTVRIAGDFREPVDEIGLDVEIPSTDAMLAYVAVTRARLTLDRSGLAWVDRWLPELAETGSRGKEA